MAVCKNCGLTPVYDPEKKKLFCKSCGSTFAPEEIDDENREYLEDRNPIPADEVYGDDPGMPMYKPDI